MLDAVEKCPVPPNVVPILFVFSAEITKYLLLGVAFKSSPTCFLLRTFDVLMHIVVRGATSMYTEPLQYPDTLMAVVHDGIKRLEIARQRIPTTSGCSRDKATVKHFKWLLFLFVTLHIFYILLSKRDYTSFIDNKHHFVRVL